MNTMMTLRGTRLYVEDHNPAAETVLLYLHGGPGASSVDFGYYQAGALAFHMRVIALDQRGVLRSDPLKANEPFGLHDIIEDCEAIRIQLGIEQWYVLGHSFGAMVAFRYALRYPESVTGVIFEGPCFDVRSSMRTLIRAAATYYDSQRNREKAGRCLDYLEGQYTAQELWHAWGEIGSALGMRKDEIYFRGIQPESYHTLVDRIVPDSAMWEKNQQHVLKLEEEGMFFENLIPELPALSQPSILLTGRHDPVCNEEQRQAYLEAVPSGSVVLFERSGHFPRLEEPVKYTEEVVKFVIRQHNA
ncbi:alpha/beta hydrolase [Paenibacillus sp. JCM 10914]|uniref:alpha/beta fold hydrolase n=1 Tax=Paenibacillus sp. JCM 10914 TaxID=1236974 RepID=UPI0003CC751E|nr:alpha/beta hydrolase [Paenibacillus sp. JCM 10914]GAE06849.1 hypothetical protein JCM10914_3036 [Paenibacillus sp. JCM 10914]